MTTEKPIIRQSLTEVFGELSECHQVDAHEGVRVDIVKAEDSPHGGVVSYATVGLSVVPIGYISNNVSLGAEIVSAADSRYERYVEVLASCVQDIFHLKFKLFPGAVYKNALQSVFPELGVKHLIFDTPHGWENDLLSLNLGTRHVAWIMAVPVTDAELDLFNKSDSGALQDRMEASGVEIYDLGRESVV